MLFEKILLLVLVTKSPVSEANWSLNSDRYHNGLVVSIKKAPKRQKNDVGWIHKESQEILEEILGGYFCT